MNAVQRAVISKTKNPLAIWTSEFSVYHEMIFQMLSRGEYTLEQIATFMGCPVKAVKIVAVKSREDIKANHREYVKCRKQMNENVRRTADQQMTDDVGIYAAIAQLVSMYGGRRHGPNVRRGYGD